MKQLKSIFALMLAFAMTLTLAACGGGNNDGGETSSASGAGSADPGAAPSASFEEVEANLDYQSADLSGLRIGYVTITSSAPWGGLVGTSFEKYAKEVGATVNALDAQTNTDQVTEYCHQMIDAGVDALVVFGGDIQANADIAKEASDAGIPMFMAGLDVAESGRENVAAVVGPNQEQMTADIAKYVVEENGEDEDYTVVQINGVPFLEDYIERCAGFQGYMASYSNYDLSAEPADCFSSRTDAKSAMEAFMATYDVDIVMGYDDDLTMGAVQAIEEAGKTGEIKVYSLTGQNDAIQAVKDGQLMLTVINRAQDIGAGLVTAIADYMANGSTAYYHRTPLTFVTPENVDEYIGKGEF